MELNLSGKTALVTAASEGLGYACANSLVAEGVNVVVVGRDQAKINVAIDKLTGLNKGKVYGIKGDLSNRSDLNSILHGAKKILDNIDILVVSTGQPPTNYLTRVSDEDWDKGIDLILRPAIYLSRELLPAMKETGFGRVILIGSLYGKEPQSSSVVSSTLRSSLNALSKCIANEYASYGITSNVIACGFFNTPLLQGLAKIYAENQKKTVEEVFLDWKKLSPSNKIGDPDHLGSLVAFIASELGEFINGATINMDGGSSKHF